MNDPYYAELIAEHHLTTDPSSEDDGPRLSELGSLERRLDKLIDLGKANLAWSQKIAGVKSPKPLQPEPQPKSLVTKIIRRKEQEASFEIGKQFGFDESDFFVSAA